VDSWSPFASAIRSASDNAAIPSSSRPPQLWISASASASRASTRRRSAPAWSASRTAVSNEVTPAMTAPAETAAAPASVIAWIELTSTTGADRRRSRRASRIAGPGAAPSSRSAVADQAANWASAASSSPARRLQADEQRLVVLVQGARHGCPDRQGEGAVDIPAREVPQGGLVQDRLGSRRRASPLETAATTRRPRVLEVHPVEQLLAEAGEGDGWCQ
jgi:hypothetical protein